MAAAKKKGGSSGAKKGSSSAKAQKSSKTRACDLYKIEGETFERILKICPRCGPGTFMADHGERLACGKCGYTEWKQKQ